jgi:DNA-binding transcriptional ArsR family regulator
MVMTTRVMDLTGARSRVGVDVVPSTSVEFLMTLTKFSMEGSRETFEDGSTWFDEVRTKTSPELLAALAAVNGKAGVGWGSLAGPPLGVALQRPSDHTVSEFLRRMEALPPRELWLILAGYYIPPLREEVGREDFLRAADGDTSSRSAILDAARKWEDEMEEEPPLMYLSAEQLKNHILTALKLWHREVFAEREEEVTVILERDAAAKRALAATTTPEKLIEIATNGIEFRGERWVRRVVLLPHVAMRPWNVSSAWEDRWIICYPVADESLGDDRTAPPPRMLRLYKALGDEKRLRILKRLVSGQATLQELADSVGLAKSSVHHHMVILRSAGLVKVTEDIPWLYTLRTDTIPEASGLLANFLEGVRS